MKRSFAISHLSLLSRKETGNSAGVQYFELHLSLTHTDAPIGTNDALYQEQLALMKRFREGVERRFFIKGIPLVTGGSDVY